ncbi:unnamed protein product [Schistocephalus solidus]|uniref:Uncharacterized protein n=1 Tax=Schistocephalus solidus TaxID=70667 RepID=A0A3P7BPP1_SCHSO|nr:unnamed protein product [Schistocephalus solidus]
MPSTDCLKWKPTPTLTYRVWRHTQHRRPSPGLAHRSWWFGRWAEPSFKEPQVRVANQLEAATGSMSCLFR